MTHTCIFDIMIRMHMSMATFKYLATHPTWQILPNSSADAYFLLLCIFQMHFWSTVHSNFIFQSYKSSTWACILKYSKSMSHTCAGIKVIMNEETEKIFYLRLEKLWFCNWSFFFDPSIDTAKVIFRISFYGFSMVTISLRCMWIIPGRNPEVGS